MKKYSLDRFWGDKSNRPRVKTRRYWLKPSTSTSFDFNPSCFSGTVFVYDNGGSSVIMDNERRSTSSWSINTSCNYHSSRRHAMKIYAVRRASAIKYTEPMRSPGSPPSGIYPPAPGRTPGHISWSINVPNARPEPHIHKYLTVF